MATLKLYLDTRASRADGKYPLKIVITHKTHAAYLGLNIYIKEEQWNSRTQKVVNHPSKDSYNRHITNRVAAVDEELLKLIDSGKAREMSATEIKNHIQSILDPKEDKPAETFYNAFIDKINSTASEGTKVLYERTLKTIEAYTNVRRLDFKDITPEWLTKYNKWRKDSAPSQNARNIDLRNIRAVFNYARKRGLTEYYPFLMYSVKPEATRKRSLTIDELRVLINWKVQPTQQRYLDYFKLILYLIGINLKDLAYLKKSDYSGGRIHYVRFKGKRGYDIKVEPEAADIIKRHKGKGEYLLDIMDGRKSYKTFGAIMNRTLQHIGEWELLNNYGKANITALNDQLTTYWARHTWATIARNECNISRDDIRLSLGHGEKTVTDIYINEDLGRIDAANRKVIDCILQKGDFAPKTDDN